MRTRILLFFIFAITLFAIGTTVTLLFNSAPENRGIIVGLYVAIYISIFGCMSLAFYGYNRYQYEATPPWKATSASIKYSLLASLFVAIILFLGSKGLLNWFSAITMLIIMAVLALLWNRVTEQKVIRKK